MYDFGREIGAQTNASTFWWAIVAHMSCTPAGRVRVSDPCLPTFIWPLRAQPAVGSAREWGRVSNSSCRGPCLLMRRYTYVMNVSLAVYRVSQLETTRSRLSPQLGVSWISPKSSTTKLGNPQAWIRFPMYDGDGGRAEP